MNILDINILLDIGLEKIIITFLDDFVFYGSLGKMYKQIGNTVPVLLSEKLAKEIKKNLLILIKEMKENNYFIFEDVIQIHDI